MQARFKRDSIINNQSIRSYATDNSNSTLDWEYWVNKVPSPQAETTSERVSAQSSRVTNDLISDDSVLFNNLLQTISATNKKTEVTPKRAPLSPAKKKLQREEKQEPMKLREMVPYVRAMLKYDPDTIDSESVRLTIGNGAPHSELFEKIKREVDEQHEKLSNEDFDKLFYEAKAENLVLKDMRKRTMQVDQSNESNRKLAEMLVKLEPDTLSLAPNHEFRELIDSLLDGSMSTSNLSEVVREAKSNYARKSIAQRKNEEVLMSYKFYLKQRELDFEMMRKERAFAALVKKSYALKQQSPELYQQHISDLRSKILPPGSIDGVLNRIAAGDSIPEVKRYFDSLTYDILKKPEYEIDVHEEYRNEIQDKIDRMQEGLAFAHGRKTGRRGPTPIRFTLTSDEQVLRELSKATEGGSFIFPFLDIKTASKILPQMLANEKIEPKMVLSYKHGKTHLAPRAADKRQKRTEKRRQNIVRLENTVRAFMWIRKHKPKFFA